MKYVNTLALVCLAVARGANAADYTANACAAQDLADNRLAATFTPADDSVCRGSLRVEKGEFFTFHNPKGVPTGSESWTMSIYAKMVEAPTTGGRAFMNLGGAVGAELDGDQSFFFGYVSPHGQLFAKFAGNTGIVIDSDWHHYAVTYNGSTVRIYFDEQEAATVDIALDLVESLGGSTMMIGDINFGNTPVVWLFDEAVFGRGVLGFDVLRAPCLRTEAFSRYPLDGDFLDTALAGNSLDVTFTPADDSVCGGSLRVEKGEFFAFRNPNGVPTGSESWTMSIYAKMVEAPTAGMRAFMNLGHGDDDFSDPGIEGFWFGYSGGNLMLRIYFDEKEAATVDITLDLVKASRYSTMMIGDIKFGNTPVARDGVWLFDEAVFGRGVLGFDVLRAPCVPNAPVESP
ncbi:hypothetical protein DIPPA_30210 [Diplonema papillatum]|nr:hypothetical protein DIPPA_30210 [Diplonema papillatum]